MRPVLALYIDRELLLENFQSAMGGAADSKVRGGGQHAAPPATVLYVFTAAAGQPVVCCRCTRSYLPETPLIYFVHRPALPLAAALVALLRPITSQLPAVGPRSAAPAVGARRAGRRRLRPRRLRQPRHDCRPGGAPGGRDGLAPRAGACWRRRRLRRQQPPQRGEPAPGVPLVRDCTVKKSLACFRLGLLHAWLYCRRCAARVSVTSCHHHQQSASDALKTRPGRHRV